MKRNKGYTLVEMIVAVAVLLIVLAELGSLMVNSQHLYRNGFYELNMQENAQQVIQQVQDLMMNTAGKSTDGSYTGSIERAPSKPGGDTGIESDIITITTKIREIDGAGNAKNSYIDVVYRIGRDIDFGETTEYLGTNSGGKDMRYSNLMLEVTKTDTLGNSTTERVPMAEGVRAIHLTAMDGAETDSEGHPVKIITNYTTADLVTLTVEMQNQQYSYTASGETYLRNQPGSGGPNIDPDGGSTGGDVNINVLRVHQYDLTDYVPEEYVKFKWADDVPTSTKALYTLTESGALNCNGLDAPGKWSNPKVEATIWAAALKSDGTPDWDESKCQEIKIHTLPVSTGVKLPIYGPDRSDPYVSTFPVEGICVCDSCIATRKMEAQVTLEPLKSYTGESGFDLAVFCGATNCDLKRDNGTAFASMTADSSPCDEVGNWLNKPFATGYTETEGGKTYYRINPKMRIEFDVYKKDGADSGHATRAELLANYSNLHTGTHCNLANANANWTTKLTFSSINAGTSNCLALECREQVQDGQDYWNNFVDHGGYVRVKMSVTFNSAITGTTPYTCYGYVFPKEFGSEAQHQHLWNMMKSTEY
ncbi:MAG: type II secretion system protein, partial [Lachnospiraceae bacterium]|nr:type II secretion system protein [Lachnospiraceae bacterium]